MLDAQCKLLFSNCSFILGWRGSRFLIIWINWCRASFFIERLRRVFFFSLYLIWCFFGYIKYCYHSSRKEEKKCIGSQHMHCRVLFRFFIAQHSISYKKQASLSIYKNVLSIQGVLDDHIAIHSMMPKYGYGDTTLQF